jgi:hypothetical protein
VIPDVKGSDRNAVQISLGRMPNKDEIEAFNALQSKYGFGGMANTEDGVSFLPNFDKPATTADVKKQMKAMQKELDAVIPGAKMQQGRFSGGYINYADEYAKANAGQGKATQKYVDEVLGPLKEQAPAMYEKLLSSDAVAAKAGANLDRLQQYGMQGQRGDYEELLKIVKQGKLRGLLDRVEKVGYAGLPAVGAFGLLGSRDEER